MHRDGTLVRVKPDGSEEKLPTEPISPMTDEAIEAAAANDPDNPPLKDMQLRRLEPMPRVKTLRRALALTQKEFASRYHIPLGTLRDWEQGRREPDQPARAFLTAIARDPEWVKRTLQAAPDR
jgi:putative transcriptional regulator